MACSCSCSSPASFAPPGRNCTFAHNSHNIQRLSALIVKSTTAHLADGDEEEQIMNLYGVILAGGGGTRLWPLSRQHRPKPLLNLLGERSMLQDTVARL